MGTVSDGDPNVNLDLLHAALKGGPEFSSRLDSLQNVQKAYEKAYADLNLGRAARDILDAAEAIKADAKAMKQKAEEEVAQLLADAREQVRVLLAQADVIHEGAETHATQARSDAEKIMQAATNKARGLDERERFISARELDLIQAQERTKKAEEAAKEAEKKYKEAAKEKSEAAKKHRAALEAMQ